MSIIGTDPTVSFKQISGSEYRIRIRVRGGEKNCVEKVEKTVRVIACIWMNLSSIGTLEGEIMHLIIEKNRIHGKVKMVSGVTWFEIATGFTVRLRQELDSRGCTNGVHKDV